MDVTRASRGRGFGTWTWTWTGGLLLALAWSEAARGCEWEPVGAEARGLVPSAVADGGARELLRVPGLADPERCRARCCELPGCDLALLGLPMDAASECLLFACEAHGRDACVLQPSTQQRLCGRRARAAPDALNETLRVTPTPARRPEVTDVEHQRCLLPLKVGSCRAWFPRFFYNASSQSCQGFIFGGCQENANNFESLRECEAACGGVSGKTEDKEDNESVDLRAKEMSEEEFSERCEAKPEAGPCRALFRRWFYDVATGGCRTFVFGGCRGNRNNYQDREACENICAGVKVMRSSAEVPSQEYMESCLVTPDPGPCRAAFPSFYYDLTTGTCTSFLYGGCQGNGNRYDTLAACQDRCSGKRLSAGRGHSTGFFLLLAMAGMMMVLLLILVVRRCRLRGHAPYLSDKEELLPEQDLASISDSQEEVDRT